MAHALRRLRTTTPKAALASVSVVGAFQAVGMARASCIVHLTALRWNKSKAQADDAEEPNYLDDMTEVIGTRYCEPSKMKPAEKYNSIKRTSLQFCVQGTFIPEGYAMRHHRHVLADSG